MNAVDELGQHERHRECVQADHKGRQRLLAQLDESAAVEEALGARRHHLGGEESDQEHTDESADEVHADDVERIVVAEPELQADRERADDPGGQTDDQCAEGVDRPA